MTTFDLQRYPWNLYLMKNVEDNVVFPTRKVFISVRLINKECTSHICRETANDNIHFVEAKAFISNSFLTIQSYKRNHCKSDIAIFAWRVTWNYAYSPFKFLRIEISKAPPSLHTSIEHLMLMISLTLDTISWS